jgi:hypothetical protein
LRAKVKNKRMIETGVVSEEIKDHRLNWRKKIFSQTRFTNLFLDEQPPFAWIHFMNFDEVDYLIFSEFVKSPYAKTLFIEGDETDQECLKNRRFLKTIVLAILYHFPKRFSEDEEMEKSLFHACENLGGDIKRFYMACYINQATADTYRQYQERLIVDLFLIFDLPYRGRLGKQEKVKMKIERSNQQLPETLVLL